MSGSIYTIGYATKPLEMFINQLKDHDISAVVDVRSVPFSKRFYDYHQPSIRSALKQHGMHYIYMGDELGPRSKSDEHYNAKRQIQFDRLMQSDLFLGGIERLKQGVKKGHKIALMCAEKAPLDCHRSLLIGFYLKRYLQVDLDHIQHNGSLVSQSELERVLLREHNLESDMFMEEGEAIENAWRCQCEQKNYIKPEEESENG